MEKSQRINAKNTLQLSGIGFFVLLLVIAAILNGLLKDEEEKMPEQEAGAGSPFMPDQLEFCGEEVPLQYYDVFESLERELIVDQYFHSQTLLQIKKVPRYFPIVEPILKQYNVPDDFKYLMVAESNLAYTVSPAGAAGFWQLLESTAKDYGLEVNDEVDERYQLEKATEAACKYLMDSHEKYGNWTMVAASYNVGRRGVDRQIDRQGESGYYDLLFNEETARYVYRVLALKLVLTQPEKYNFNVPENECYQPVPFSPDTVRKPIPDMGEYARVHGTNYKMLKYLNPWLRDKVLSNPSGKEYIIKIPKHRKIN